MQRSSLLASAIVLVMCVLGQPAVASADDPTPIPSPPATTGDPAPTNAAPVAVDDPGSTVAAGGKVTLSVLANDTDDGLGRPDGEAPHLEVATYDSPEGRVVLNPAHTVLTFASRATDAGTSFRIAYTASDGELTSNVAIATVRVIAASAPPVKPSVSLSTAREVIALHTYSLHGSIHPLPPGRATVLVQRRSGSSWVRFKQTRVHAHGRYSVAFKTSYPKRFVFRTVTTLPNGAKATSARLVRQVVAHIDAKVSGPLTRSSVRYSYRAGCPVGPGDLRKITLNQFTYGRAVARGALVVRASVVPAILRVFRSTFATRFPIHSMVPTDAFYAGGHRTPTQSDVAAMRADNTSGFNCRPVTGNPYRVSQHSYGNAIDINTVRNPYVVGNSVYPSFARTYLNRAHVRTGMITRTGVVASTMRRNGWLWGARWSDPDYQHFSSNGG